MRLVGNRLILTVEEARTLGHKIYFILLEAVPEKTVPRPAEALERGSREITVELPLESAEFPVNGHGYIAVAKNLEKYERVFTRAPLPDTVVHEGKPAEVEKIHHGPFPPPKEETALDGVLYPEPKLPLTFRRFQEVCALRSAKWHAGDGKEFTILETAGAMCGEAGEAANVAKKIRKFDLGLSQRAQKKDRSALVFGLAQEIADTITYLSKLASQADIDLEGAIIYTFNNVSDREGFEEKL